MVDDGQITRGGLGEAGCKIRGRGWYKMLMLLK